MLELRGVVGVDEVGRGAWAGPVVVVAATLKRGIELGDWAGRVNDSKKLSRLERERLSVRLEEDTAWGLGLAGPLTIDGAGIAVATEMAAWQAFGNLRVAAPWAEGMDVLVDGVSNLGLASAASGRCLTMPQADGQVWEVAAASILAKVWRDRLMRERVAKAFPGYGFESHVGYGTEEHRAALEELGLCDVHRRSFKPMSLMEARLPGSLIRVRTR